MKKAADTSSQCPYCGKGDVDELLLSELEALSLSHAELCTALRLAGRLILRLQKQDEQSANKIRCILKRANNVRRSMRTPNQLPQVPDAENAPPSGTTAKRMPIVNGRPPKSVVNQKRFTRPRSLHLVTPR